MSLKSKASSNNQRARELSLAYNLHEHDLQFALNFFENKCAYCRTEFEDYFEVDHIIPISHDEDDEINFGSVAYNIVPCCPVCNQSKGTKLPHGWILANFDDADEIWYRLVEYQNACGISDLLR